MRCQKTCLLVCEQNTRTTMTTPTRDSGRTSSARLLDLLPGGTLIFRVVCGGGRDTIPFVSTSQDRSSWGQGHNAMKREQSAGETCSGNPAGSGRQHRAMRLKTTGNHAFAVEHTRTRPNLSRLDQNRVWRNIC